MTFEHGQVGDVSTPDLIARCDVQVSQQIGIDLMLDIPLTQSWFGIYGIQAQCSHQSLYSLAADGVALGVEKYLHTATAIKGRFEILLIQQTHDAQFF